MSVNEPVPTGRIVNEPLRLLLSQQERDYIDARIARARRQLRWAIGLPVVYAFVVGMWKGLAEYLSVSSQFVGVSLVLAFFILFGVTFHLLLAGIVDWIMFARYRRNHRAFLNRYNRT